MLREQLAEVALATRKRDFKRGPNRPLAWSSTIGAVPMLSLKSDQWTLLEAELGADLTVEAREATVRIVKTYFEQLCFEESAPLLEDIEKRVRAIRKAALKFEATLDERQNAESEDALLGVSVRLELPTQEPRYGTRMDDFRQRLSDFVWATGAAMKDVQDQKTSPRKSGDAWRSFVRSLRQTFDRLGLPHKVSKKSGNVRKEHSPFVRFFDRLQKAFPKEMTRPSGSGLEALAARMSAASRRS
jgi:hypothetical protein